MRFNYKRELEKFQKNWEKQAAIMRQHGMDEQAIEDMYKHDFAEFKKTRNYFLHHDEYSDEHCLPEYLHAHALDKSALMDAQDMISALDLLDQIGNPALLEGLKALKPQTLKILIMAEIHGLTDAQIAVQLGAERSSITHKLRRAKIFLKKFF